jgi:hypothetical protein
VQRRPQVYQKADLREDPVPGHWVLGGSREARFEVGTYDPKRTLVIDPVLVYSSYLGGSGSEEGHAIAVDGSGSVYVTGWTDSPDFPTLNPYQAGQAPTDVFVTKFSPSGESLMYSTYIGGSAAERGFGIAVDGSGSAYVTGRTDSPDFPIENPYQTDQGTSDGFVAKLSPSGDSLIYSTYLGGSSTDYAAAIAVDGSGSAYVTGGTDSPDFPIENPYQTDQGSSDGFVAKLSPSGDSLIYSTYLGGSSNDYPAAIAVDDSGNAYVTGSTFSTDFPTQSPYQGDQVERDAFVTKVSASGDTLVYSTYLGGSGDDYALDISVDRFGGAYVTGFTASTDFPIQNPYQTYQGSADAFVTKLSPSGESLVYSTYLGGKSVDRGFGIAVDSAGSAYVAGETLSADFPTESPYQLYQWVDAFVTKLSPSGDGLAYSTYLGGQSAEFGNVIAIDSAGSAYVTGTTYSTDFPTQNPSQTDQAFGDVFVAKLGPPPPTAFFTVPPCRLIDTRQPTGSYGGPALVAGIDRTFTLAGRCGISPKARSVAVNIAVTQPTAPGHLKLYPAGAALPQTSSINYGAGQTRASNAILLLTSGGITVRCNQSSGSVHFILDLTGYFE